MRNLINESERKETDACRRNEPGRDFIVFVTLGVGFFNAGAVTNTLSQVHTLLLRYTAFCHASH